MISGTSATQVNPDQIQPPNAVSWKRALSTRPRKLAAGTLALVFAAEFSYRVRELLAVLLIFSVAFLAAALVLLILFALDEAARQVLIHIYQQILHLRRKSSISLAR